MRRSTLFLLSIAALIVALGLVLAHASRQQRSASLSLEEKRLLVRQLGLTDLCLFTEARYTRNPSLTDTHSAFQDHPLAIEHFPSGSLLAPPRILSESP